VTRGASSQPADARNGALARVIPALAPPACIRVQMAPSFDSFLEGSS
jgi:hypothetical protein